MLRSLALILAVTLTASACGSSDTAEPATATTAEVTTTETPTTTAAPTTAAPTTAAPTTAAPTTAAPIENAYVPEGPEETQIVQNWDLTFGIGPFEERADALVGSAELEGTIASYVRAVEGFGSIVLPVTGLAITGETAEITFDVLGNGVTMAADLTGEMVLVDGTWKVTRESFCEAMTLARQSCPAES